MELVVFAGLQAAGKSAFFREKFAGGYEHVSKDLFRHNRNKNRRQEALIRSALSEGRSAVVDNTNPTPEDRAPLIGLGREYGAGIICFFFDAGVRDCLRRNAGREGRARVPDVAIFASAKRLVPPSWEEGFDEIHRARLTASGFEVEAVYPPGGRGREP